MVPLMGLSCALMALPFVFRAANAGKGATAWVGFGGFTVQPSELVKIVYLFVLSYLLSRRRIVTGMIFIGLMLGFLVLQRDLGTAAIYGGAGLVLLYAATSSLLLIGGILGAGVGCDRDSVHMQAISDGLRRELEAVAAAKGIDLRIADAAAGRGSAVPPTARYSTLQDLDAGRHTEIDMFSGALMRMGAELGIPTPYNEYTYHMIKALEEKNDGRFDYTGSEAVTWAK